MSDKILSSAALAAAGVAAAGLLSARPAQAAPSAPTTPVAFYFTAPPAPTGALTAANIIQIPSTSTNFPTPSTDVQIVNFALAVETIEAERYRQTIARLTNGGTDLTSATQSSGLGLRVRTRATDPGCSAPVTGFYPDGNASSGTFIANDTVRQPKLRTRSWTPLSTCSTTASTAWTGLGQWH